MTRSQVDSGSSRTSCPQVIDLSRLEPLIGIEKWFIAQRPYALLLRPLGFLVIEDANIHRCKEKIHILTKFNVDTMHALKEVNAGKCSIAGLKDSEAITSQYVSCKRLLIHNIVAKTHSVSLIPLDIDGCVKRGGIRLNFFNIIIVTTTVVKPYEKAPNYYGFQRFGTRRPNSHLLGFFLVRRSVGLAVSEMLDRKYPLESPALGDYESRVKRHLLDTRSISNISTLIPQKTRLIILSALQSYLFNRILSKLVEIYGIELCARFPRIALPGCGYRKTLQRLHADELEDIYENIMNEEGVNEKLLCKAGLGSPPRETCIHPVNPRYALLAEEKETKYVVYVFALKSGEYATTYLAAHYKLLESYPNPLAAKLA